MNEAINKLVSAESALHKDLALAHEGATELILAASKLQAEKAALLGALQVASSVSQIPVPSLMHNISKENNGWGDTGYYGSEETISYLRDKVIVCGGRSGILNAKGENPFEVDWKNLTFVQGKYPTGWGAQLNNAFGTIEGSTFLRLGDSTLTEPSGSKDGHPLYIKPNGILSLLGNSFLECQGNVQFAARPWEGDDVDFIDLIIKKNIFATNAWSPYGHGGGGASNLAIYCASNQGTNVEVTDNVYNNSIVYPGPTDSKTGPSARGFLTIWNEAFYPSQGWINKGAVKDSSKFFKSTVITGNTIRSEATDRPLIQVQGCEEILIEGNEIVVPSYEGVLPYPVIRIDHDPTNPVLAKRIVIKPIDAPGDIQIGQQKVPLRDGYDWKSPGYNSHTL